ncbi:hypothetical protein J6A31_06130 [bacterium]|nr:hypothetical protein [bacterium]
MKYRYITTLADMNTPVCDLRMIAGTNLKTETMVYRINANNLAMVRDPETDTYSTEDTRTLAELNATPMIKFNGEWTKCNSFAGIAMDSWENVLKDSRHVPTAHRGFINMSEYKDLMEDYKVATAGVIALSKSEKVSA